MGKRHHLIVLGLLVPAPLIRDVPQRRVPPCVTVIRPVKLGTEHLDYVCEPL